MKERFEYRNMVPVARWIAASCLLPLLVLVTSTRAQEGVRAGSWQSETHKLALLVGIDDYQYDGIPDLEGSVNDVRLMRRLLVETFGFPDEPRNIRILTNSQATRQQILRSIEEHLIDQATKDSVVVFHFSGHGSQIYEPAGSADELDRQDETLLPHDGGRDGKTQRDIVDDELHVLLNRLADKTPHLTVILDSCHAGAATRSGGRVRAVRAAPLPFGAGPRASTTPAAGADSKPVKGLEGGAYTLIAAAAEEEKAHEIYEGTSAYGALTWHLVKAIQRGGEGVTLGQVMEDVQAGVTGHFSRQSPRFVGGRGKDLVFGLRSRRRDPEVEVHRDRYGKLSLQAGRADGVTVGSIYEIFPAATRQVPSEGLTPARFEVSDVGVLTSSLRRVEGPFPSAASRAVEAIHRHVEHRARVLIDGESSPVLSRLRAELGSFEHLELVDGSRGFDLKVVLRREDVVITDASLRQLGQPIPVAPGESSLTIRSRLLDHVKWVNLLALDNDDPEIKVDFRVEIMRSRSSTPFAERKVDLTMAPGDRFKITVHNRSSRQVFFNLFDFTGGGIVSLVYPVADGPPMVVGSGEVWSQTLQAYLPGDAVSMRDVLKLVVSAEPADVASVLRVPPDGTQVKGSQEERFSQLERIVGRAAWGSGPEIGMADSTRWATFERVIEIRRP